MERSINRLLPVVFAGMFMFAGCATQDVVKKEEPIVPVAISTKPDDGALKSKTPDKPTIATTAVNSSDVKAVDQKKSQQDSKEASTADLQQSLENIYFDFDASTLSDTARQTLSKNFELLMKNPRATIRIEGNCDERGSSEYNLALGERRAKAAVSYLTTMGIPSGRLSTISYGEEKPADPGHNEAALAKNRRDEFVVIK
ncbi:peptidoglycan-associated lipoprotein Pal [Pelotalea chapellei]|uniref:Peptidoglycan-associated lipoprotein n=1 Tax=Pelotalea chapellei TaxID=44671 RepID=A0ABS5U3V8_9BACT|nr:peptidoglycan-associated lipoprotein Pal [Pelotalea chapellei]MBT1070356.1 peptidoglycan-associated lipoprotein Pal [Pelotalea chapellei]